MDRLKLLTAADCCRKSGRRVLVGVNKYVTDEPEKTNVFRPDPQTARLAIEDLERHRGERDHDRFRGAMDDLHRSAIALREGRDAGSVMASLVAAAGSEATIGEMTAVLLEVFGRNK